MKKHAAMNRCYRLVWNSAKALWQTAPEFARGNGKTKSATRRALVAACLSSVWLAGSPAFAAPLPTGGVVSAGQGSIAQSGSTMTVNQSSAKMVVDWQSFSIAQGNTVNFSQPSASAVALNRVGGNDPSLIQGALNANGQVFLVNPNGILFSSTAQVNVGGLVASTLAIANADFMAGRYAFSGSSSNAIVNQGNITAMGDNGKGGTIALIAAKISNVGSLSAPAGNVLLGAGSSVLVDLGGPVKMQIEQGTLDALIENGGAIRADGGTVMLTARSANALASTVINNTGVIEARTLATGEKGQILLLGGMEKDAISVGGRLDASAPDGGDGGHIETSAAQVNTQPGLVVTAGAALGKGGDWLIDPYDYVINATAAGNIVSALNNDTSVTVTTATSNGSYGAQASGSGDITVSSAITKTQGTQAALTLRADHSIIVNSDIGATSGKLDLTLSAANASGATSGGVNVNANLSTNGGNILIGGGAGTSTNGIGYALNLDSSNAAVVVQQNKSITSGGGDITINGKSLIGSNSGSYSGVKGGVYIKSGASILSGAGNTSITGESTAGVKTFGFAVEAASNTLTTIGTDGAGGHLLINGVNSTTGSGITDTDRANGALGLVNNGSYDRLVFLAPSVADLLVKVNGSIQSTTYTYSPPNSGCSVLYPNCGYLQVPGGNSSYLYAAYKVVNMANKAIYVSTGDGSKTYDATTAASGLTLTASGGPTGFSVSDLGALTFSTASKNAGTYLKLARGAADPTTYTAGGTAYAVSYYNGVYTISPKNVTPTVSNKIYDGTTSAVVNSSGIVAGDSVAFNYTSGAFASKDVGNAIGVTVSGISLSGADAANYTLGSSTLSASANITARPVNISGTRVYDGGTSIAAGILALGNLVSGEDLVLSGSGSVADKNAGSGKALTLGSLALANGSVGRASNYTFAGGTQAANITQASLTVSGLSAQDKVYDGSTAAALTGTATLSGVIGSDSVGVNGSAPMSGSFADKNVGSGKTVSASLTGIALAGSDAGNYRIGGFASPLTASIGKANLTISGLSAQDKVYDGSTAATLTGTAALSGVIGADSVALSGTTPSSGSFADKNAGSGKSVTASLTGASLSGGDAGNYQIAGFASPLTASIGKANLTISGLSAQDKVYDGNATATLTGTAGLSGVIGADSVALSGTTPSSGSFADKNAGSGKSVTASLSGTSLSGGDAGNYQIAGFASPLSASIGKANLTVSGLSAQDKVYDGSTAATLTGTAALSGVIGADSVSVNGSAPMSGSFSDKNVGNGKAVSASLTGIALAGSDAGNYQIGGFASPLTASIGKANLTISGLSAQDKVYDGSTAAALTGTAGLSGVIGADSVALSGTTPSSGSFADKNAGSGKSVTASLSGTSLSGGDAGNYQIAGFASPLSASIGKANLTVQADAAGKTYDGSAWSAPFSASYSGFVNGETAAVLSGTLNFGGTASGARNAGSYTISPSGLSSNNYALSFAGGTLTIAKAALTLSSSDVNKTYDGTTTASGAPIVVSGTLYGSDHLSGGSYAFANANAGSGKTLNVSGVALSDGNGGGNYDVSYVANTGSTIAPRTVTLAAAKTYDGSSALTGDVTIGNLVSGEHLSYAGAVANNGGTDSGNFIRAITLTNGTGGIAANYALPALDAAHAPTTITGSTRVVEAPTAAAPAAPTVTTVPAAVVATVQNAALPRNDVGLNSVSNLVYSPMPDASNAVAAPTARSASVAEALPARASDGDRNSSRQDTQLRLAAGNGGQTAKVMQVFVVSGGIQTIDRGDAQ